MPGGLWVRNLTWSFEMKSFYSSSVLWGFLIFSLLFLLSSLLFSLYPHPNLIWNSWKSYDTYTIITRFSVFSNTIFISYFTLPNVSLLGGLTPDFDHLGQRGATVPMASSLNLYFRPQARRWSHRKPRPVSVLYSRTSLSRIALNRIPRWAGQNLWPLWVVIQFIPLNWR